MGLDFEGELEYFGDGAMRQSAPISLAVHLGAKRVMVIGVGRKRSLPEGEAQYPSLAQIGGHAMASIFLTRSPMTSSVCSASTKPSS